MRNDHRETVADGRFVANLSSHGSGATRFKTEETMPPKRQPNNKNGVGIEGREEAQNGIDR
jgi:hypothetical protein